MAQSSQKPLNRPSDSTSSREQRLVRVAGWTLTGVLGFLLIAIMFGKQLQGVLNSLGLGFLYHEESGVYADCSRPENKTNPYCTSRSKGDQGWRNLKDRKGNPSGFSLY